MEDDVEHKQETAAAPVAARIYAAIVAISFLFANPDRKGSLLLSIVIAVLVVRGVFKRSFLAWGVAVFFHLVSFASLVVLAAVPWGLRVSALLGLQVAALGTLISPSLRRHCRVARDRPSA